jgi:phosphate/sulfate permease
MINGLKHLLRELTMPDPRPHGGEQSDLAALSAAVVAVVISLFMVPGPHDVLGAIVGLTLMFMIFGYVWNHPRTVWQSLAVSSILGGIATQIVGFILEMSFAQDPLSLLMHDNPRNLAADKGGETLVNNLWEIGTWLTFGLIAFVADRRRQKPDA